MRSRTDAADFLASPAGRSLAGLLLFLAVAEAVLLLGWLRPSIVTWPFPVGPGTTRVLLALLAVAGTFATLSAGARQGAVPAAVVVAGTALAVAYAITGLVLPWDQLAWAVFTAVRDAPVVGDLLALALFGSPTASEAVLWSALIRHVLLTALGLLVPAAAIAFAIGDASDAAAGPN